VTDDIRTKLASSEAAESLRMEYFVASCFHKHKWPAQQGVYYKDPETGKEREIDVLSHHALLRPQRYRGTGGPKINISILCECKSLSGHNLVLLRGNPDPLFERHVRNHWSGEEQHIRELVAVIGQTPYYSQLSKKELYSYYGKRAYPEGRGIAYQLRLRPPPVALVANAFRETKGGQVRGKELDDQGTASPLWSAIRSVLSATRAAENRFLAAMRSNISDRNPHTYDVQELVENDAFFFDAELVRAGCFHSVIFCKSKLFSLEETEITDVQSARLFIRNLDLDSRYVDIVNFDAAEAYIDRMISHFEKASSNAIRKTWDTLESLNWEPGQAFAELGKATGAPLKRIRRTKSSK